MTPARPPSDGDKLTAPIMQSFQKAKVFEQNKALINSLNFSSNGELLVTSGDDESINLYNCDSGEHLRTVHSKKYGAKLIRFTHADNSVLHASTKENHDIRYLSLHDNSYLRYFKGHSKEVTALSLSPVDDRFISASRDSTVRLWDIRSTNCQGVIHATGRSVASFDPDGLVFAVGQNSERINLYDARNYENGPFETFEIPKKFGCEWTDLKFSPNGKLLMIATTTGMVYLRDAFEGIQKYNLTVRSSDQGKVGESDVCFTPDSAFILAGLGDGNIRLYNSSLGSELTTFEGHHDPINVLEFNPTKMMFASACKSLAFWIPTVTP